MALASVGFSEDSPLLTNIPLYQQWFQYWTGVCLNCGHRIKHWPSHQHNTLQSGLCCVCWLAPIKEGCWLATVSKHFYGLVCHGPHLWGYQCRYHGSIQVHHPASVTLGLKAVSVSGTIVHIPVPRRTLTVLLKTGKGLKGAVGRKCNLHYNCFCAKYDLSQN